MNHPASLAALALTLTLLTGCGGNPGTAGAPTKEAVPPTTATPPPPCPSNVPMKGHSDDCTGSLPLGPNASAGFVPRLTFSIADNGWITVIDDPTIYTLLPPGGDFDGLKNGRTDKIGVYTHVVALNRRCDTDGQITRPVPGVARTPAAITHELSTRPGVIATAPRMVTVGGLHGYYVELRLAPRWTRHCFFEKKPSVPLIGTVHPVVVNHLLEAGVPYRYYFLNYGGGTLAIEVTDIGTDDLQRYDALIGSFRFS